MRSRYAVEVWKNCRSSPSLIFFEGVEKVWLVVVGRRSRASIEGCVAILPECYMLYRPGKVL